MPVVLIFYRFLDSRLDSLNPRGGIQQPAPCSAMFLIRWTLPRKKGEKQKKTLALSKEVSGSFIPHLITFFCQLQLTLVSCGLRSVLTRLFASWREAQGKNIGFFHDLWTGKESVAVGNQIPPLPCHHEKSGVIVTTYELARITNCHKDLDHCTVPLGDFDIWGFPKMVVPPKSSILIGFSIIKHPFWGIPIFGNTHMVVAHTSNIWHSHSSSLGRCWKTRRFGSKSTGDDWLTGQT